MAKHDYPSAGAPDGRPQSLAPFEAGEFKALNHESATFGGLPEDAGEPDKALREFAALGKPVKNSSIRAEGKVSVPSEGERNQGNAGAKGY